MKIIAIALTLLILPSLASAHSYSTATGDASSGIRSSMEFYRIKSGRLPTKRDEISGNYYGRDIDDVYPQIQPLGDEEL